MAPMAIRAAAVVWRPTASAAAKTVAARLAVAMDVTKTITTALAVVLWSARR